MPTFRHATLITLSGLLWFTVGVSLLSLGLSLLVFASENAGNFPLIEALERVVGSADSAALLCVCAALGIGYFKGRYVLLKSVRRVVERICSVAEPRTVAGMYSWQYCALIGSMVLLGISIKHLGIPSDIRGVVDVAVGGALVNGAMIYFRFASVVRREAKAD